MDSVVQETNIPTVIVLVKGGNIIAAHSSAKTRFIVVDYDNIEEGDNHPFEDDGKLSEVLKDMQEIY